MAKGLKSIRDQHGPASLAGLVAPTATLEEGGLLAMLLRTLGSENVDAALRQQDDRLRAAPLLGRPLASLSHLDAAFVIGSQLRHEVPLLHQRLRKAWKRGAKVHVINPVDFEFAFETASRAIVAPSAIADALGNELQAAAVKDAAHAVVLVGAVAE